MESPAGEATPYDGRNYACRAAVRAAGAGVAAMLIAGAAHGVDYWDIDDDFGAVSIADEHWTVDEAFPGRKLILDGRYALRRRTREPSAAACECASLQGPTERMTGVFGAHVQWGSGDTDVEYGVLSFAALASQRDFDASADGFRPLRDTVEWIAVRLAQDEPLGIDSYSELTVARVARTWGYHAAGSPWRFTLGVSVSGGFAWADSTDETFRDVSNLIAGTWVQGSVSRDRWGRVYLEQRIVNGWTFSSPARGGSVSREAVARFGYERDLPRCMSLEVFAEKRSFNFADPDRANLYTKAKRVGVQLACTF
ncbi:MAG TPA: hypothetical protein VIN61_15740 [Gammaproteobacteria bacterium]